MKSPNRPFATRSKTPFCILYSGIAALFALTSPNVLAGTVSWNMNSATGTISNPTDFSSGGTITQYNNNGTTTLITTTSASSGYAGATGTNNAGAAARTGVLNIAAAGSAAFEFSFAPSAGSTITFSDLVFGSRSTSTGPQAWTLRSSLDSFATDITSGTFSADSTWRLLDATNFSVAATAPITFRLFGFSGAGTAGTNTANWRIDDMVLTYSFASGATTLYFDTNGATGGIGGSGVWDTTTSNWSTAATGDVAPTTFTPASPVVFGGTAGTVTVDAGGVTANGGLQVDTSGYSITGGTLSLGSPTVNTTHSAGTATTISAPVAGSVGLTKIGPGTLVLSSASNSFSGNVTIGEGKLSVGSDSNLGAAANDIQFTGGVLVASNNVSLGASRDLSGSGKIEVAASKTITVAGVANLASLVLSGPGTVSLDNATAASRAAGDVTFSDAGTLASAAGAITAGNLAYTSTSASTATISAPLDLGSGVLRTVTVSDGSENVDLVLSGSIKQLGGSGTVKLHKLGTGTLSLDGDNSGANGLTGSLRIGTAGTTTQAGGTVVISSQLALGGSSNAIQIQFNDGVLRSTANLTGANAIPLGLSFGAGQGVPATFNGSPMEFTGASSFFKPTATAMTHKVTVNTDVILTGQLQAASGTGTTTGVLLDGTGSLTLANATNAHDLPITMTNATLFVNGALTSNLATIAVNSAGRLGGSGSIAGNTVVSTDGLLAPGAAASAGTLTFGGTLDISGAVASSGATMQFDLGASSDKVLLTSGALTIGSGLLEFSDFSFIAGAGFGGGTFTLFDSATAINGSLGSSLSGTVGGLSATISLADGTNDVVLNVVPEPGTLASLIGGFALLGLRRRRK